MVKKKPKNNLRGLISDGNLQGLFFDQLRFLNNNISRPIPLEAIHYSSVVLSKFSETKEYFEEVEVKFKNKVLGIKLLECSNLTRNEQKSILIDVGETSMLLCGMFRDSLNKKLNNSSYYNELGKVAYKRLDCFIPHAYEMRSFYGMISSYFTVITTMVNAISKSNFDIKNKCPFY